MDQTLPKDNIALRHEYLCPICELNSGFYNESTAILEPCDNCQWYVRTIDKHSNKGWKTVEVCALATVIVVFALITMPLWIK